MGRAGEGLRPAARPPSEARTLTPGRSLIAPVARALHAARVSPNAVSLAGLVLVIGGSALVAADQPSAAFVALLAGSLADTLDGELARLSGQASVFGAFLDSTIDRVSDAALYLGATALAFRAADPILLLAALWALVASFLVSYTRAKAESLARSASVGVGPREARIAILVVGVALWALLGDVRLFTGAVAVTAAFATVTVAQRIAHVARQQ